MSRGLAIASPFLQKAWPRVEDHTVASVLGVMWLTSVQHTASHLSQSWGAALDILWVTTLVDGVLASFDWQVSGPLRLCQLTNVPDQNDQQDDYQKDDEPEVKFCSNDPENTYTYIIVRRLLRRDGIR